MAELEQRPSARGCRGADEGEEQVRFDRPALSGLRILSPEITPSTLFLRSESRTGLADVDTGETAPWAVALVNHHNLGPMASGGRVPANRLELPIHHVTLREEHDFCVIKILDELVYTELVDFGKVFQVVDGDVRPWARLDPWKVNPHSLRQSRRVYLRALV